MSQTETKSDRSKRFGAWIVLPRTRAVISPSISPNLPLITSLRIVSYKKWREKNPGHRNQIEKELRESKKKHEKRLKKGRSSMFWEKRVQKVFFFFSFHHNAVCRFYRSRTHIPDKNRKSTLKRANKARKNYSLYENYMIYQNYSPLIKRYFSDLWIMSYGQGKTKTN